MRMLLKLVGVAVYILIVLCLAAIVLARFLEIGVWYRQGGTIYAREIPASLSAVCVVMLILLVGAGVYRLRRKTTRLT